MQRGLVTGLLLSALATHIEHSTCARARPKQACPYNQQSRQPCSARLPVLC
jgi:hypothetical protein